MTKPAIGFIGLGLMGSAIVGRLQDKGYAITALANVNRSGIDAALARARSDGSLAAFLHIELDRLKGINDTLGRSVGDAFLQQVARLLKGEVRPTDIVGPAGS